ncbi:hypothetical protein [Microbacterium sp.]|uniref:hypothetical protein n=1 Tax=Microbacterium sp. TaxID=51671 RepID=UPI003241F9C2
MGAGLVKAAYDAAQRRGLREHAPMRLYVFMAVTALDDSDEPSYYGGREALADALAAPRTPGGFKLVRQAVSALVARGFLELKSRPSPNHNARYRLMDGNGSVLSAKRSGAPSDSPEASTGHLEGAVKNSEQSTLKVSTGHPEGLNGAPSDSPRGVQEHYEHPHEPNAHRALITIIRERSLPLPIDELMEHAYRLGAGDPWAGYQRIKVITAGSFSWADDPAAVIRSRLKKAGAAA